MNRPSATALAVRQELVRPQNGPASQATHVEQSRAVAEVQAMVVVAQQNPRSEAEAINKIAESCKQLGLAERAFFKFPRGGTTVQGASIHLAVELARCWGNVDYGVKEMGRDDMKGESEMVAYAWDTQTNTRAATSFIVPHKRDKKGGAEWLVDMRDIYENNANNAARRLREMIFRVVPPYIRVMAEDACRDTLQRGTSEKPMNVQIADMLTTFEQIGVSRERIETRIGMRADAMTPVDLANLRIAYRSIKQGEISAEEEFPTTTAVALDRELKAPPKTNGAPTEEPPPPAEAQNLAMPFPMKGDQPNYDAYMKAFNDELALATEEMQVAALLVREAPNFIKLSPGRKNALILASQQRTAALAGTAA